MQTPIDPLVAEMVAMLDEDLREAFEERAAIVEYEGGADRAHAEALAMLDLLERHPEALSNVTVFAFEIDGDTHFVVTTDADLASKHAERTGAAACRTDAIARVVRDEFGGLAALSAV